MLRSSWRWIMSTRKQADPADSVEAEPKVRRVTLMSHSQVVGYGQVFEDMFTQLYLIGLWEQLHTINAPSLASALTRAFEVYPGLNWEWTCGDA